MPRFMQDKFVEDMTIEDLEDLKNVISYKCILNSLEK